MPLRSRSYSSGWLPGRLPCSSSTCASAGQSVRYSLAARRRRSDSLTFKPPGDTVLRLQIFAVAAALAPALSAGYSNLIATSDGNAVYLQAKTGFVLASWYVVRNSISGPTLNNVPDPRSLEGPFNGKVADVSGGGTTLAFAGYADRFCGYEGSRC